MQLKVHVEEPAYHNVLDLVVGGGVVNVNKLLIIPIHSQYPQPYPKPPYFKFSLKHFPIYHTQCLIVDPKWQHPRAHTY